MTTTGAGTAVDTTSSGTNTKKGGKPSSTTSSGKKKGWAAKSPHPSKPTGPTTRSGAVRAAAGVGTMVYATGAVPAQSPPASRTKIQKKAQLKSFETSFGGFPS